MTIRAFLFCAALPLLAAVAPHSGRVASAQIARPPELRLQFARAERAFRTGSSPLEAKSRLDRVIAALPEDVEAHLLRAQVLLALNRPADALADARRAASLRPSGGLAFLLICEAAREEGLVTEAQTALETAGRLITTGAAQHVRLSFNAQMLGLLDEAEAYARVAHTLDPAMPGGVRQLAHVFLAKGRTDAAATLLSEGLAQGVLSPADLLEDPILAGLKDHRELRSWLGS